eukprot:913170-Prorocentrum_lima.AAC.1
MTSSLVGSEMCIRDSSLPPHVCKQYEEQSGLATDVCSIQSERSNTIPVSYTHLTLPTICSV